MGSLLNLMTNADGVGREHIGTPEKHRGSTGARVSRVTRPSISLSITNTSQRPQWWGCVQQQTHIVVIDDCKAVGARDTSVLMHRNAENGNRCQGRRRK